MPCSTNVHSNLTMSGAKAAEEGKNESTRISFVAISNISFRTVHPMFHPTFHPPILIFHQSRITARKEIRQGMIGTSSPLVFLFFFFVGSISFSFSHPFFSGEIIHPPPHRRRHRRRPIRSARSVPIAASPCHHPHHHLRRPASSLSPFPAPS